MYERINTWHRTFLKILFEKENNIFQCTEGAAYIPTDPLTYLWKLLLWFLSRVTCFTTQFVNLPLTYGKVHPDEDAPDPPPPARPYLYHYPCDQKRTLYMMNETVAAKVVRNNPEHCSKPYYAQRVSILFSIILI